ncbi:MAG: helix-turn-helix transcriptional regulator [Eggerthellaceae bacterium]|nr:helix-turn-helix transcriptional regulator [Eggerthellaceae bacterium]
MNLQLQRLRKKAGIKTQKAMADKLGIPERTYASWERQEVMMNLEQAYNCAVALGCTLNDLVGMKDPERNLSKDEERIIDTYRSVTVHGKKAMLSNTKAVRADYMPKSDEADVLKARSAC